MCLCITRREADQKQETTYLLVSRISSLQDHGEISKGEPNQSQLEVNNLIGDS